MNKLEIIAERFFEHDILKADGFDEAVIGIDEKSMRLIYSCMKCIEILMKRDKMKFDEALEYFNFNVEGAYVGESTPIWCSDIF